MREGPAHMRTFGQPDLVGSDAQTTVGFHSLVPANVHTLNSGTEVTEQGLLFTWAGKKQHSYKHVFFRIDPERKGLCYFAERATFKTIKLCLWVSPLGT